MGKSKKKAKKWGSGLRQRSIVETWQDDELVDRDVSEWSTGRGVGPEEAKRIMSDDPELEPDMDPTTRIVGLSAELMNLFRIHLPPSSYRQNAISMLDKAVGNAELGLRPPADPV